MTQSFKHFLEQSGVLASLNQDSAIFIYPAIPHNKIQGAMSSYIPATVQPNDIVVLIDDTVFGGAKEGLVITEHALYMKEAFESPRTFALHDIQSMTWSKDFFGASLLINGAKVIGFSQLSKQGVATFVQVVSDYLSLIRRQVRQNDGNQGTKNQATGRDQQTESFDEMYPLIDILAHLVLLKDPVWTSEKVKLVKMLLEDFVENNEQMALLQARLKMRDRPSLDESFKNLLRITDDDDVKEFVLRAICEIARLDGEEDEKSLWMVAMMFGKKLRIDEHRLTNIYLSYMDDLNAEQPVKHDEHVAWACTTLDLAPQLITRETVQQAYRAKIKEFHPDKYQSLPESIQKMLNEKTQELNKAKDILVEHYS